MRLTCYLNVKSFSCENKRTHLLNAAFLILSGIRAQKASNVNFTRVLWNILPWQQVVDIEFYATNKSKFAYCHTSNCTKERIDSSDVVPVFWNRLRVKHGSLLLTRIKQSDDELEIRVKVHLNDDSARSYTLKILLVNGSQGNYY